KGNEQAGSWPVEALGKRLSLKNKYTAKKIIWWVAAFVGIITLTVIGYLIYQVLTLSGIGLNGKYPDQILLGDPFDFIVEYSNNSASVLSGAQLSVTLPNEFSFINEDNSKRTLTKDVGNIGVGTIASSSFRVIAASGSQTSKRLTIGLDYGSSVVGPRFHKETVSDVFIGDSAASLDLTAPDKVLSGEVFELRISYKNVSPHDFKDVQLSLGLPANFTLKTSSVKPDKGLTWQFGDLKAGSSDELVIQGTMLAPANSFFDVKATLSSDISGSRHAITEKSKSIAVSASPLAISVALNGTTDYVAKASDSLLYDIAYTNNTDVGFRDVIITAQLAGAMFDLTQLTTQGGFNSLARTLTWDASNDPALRVLQPGASGKVSFQIPTLPNYPISRFNDKNFTLKIDAQIESPTVPSFISADKTLSIDQLETKIKGAVAVRTSVLFRDAASGILNKGQLPFKIDTPVQLTAHWFVTNYATDVSDVEVTGVLQSNVKATGVIKSNTDTKPEYNERTGEMSWKIPKIESGRGVLNAPLEAIFQIEVQPPLTAIGSFMPLIGETNIEASDIFTGLDLIGTSAAVTTNMQDDPTVQPGERQVVQ
ncbi:MAG: hypothetical protein Q8P97_01210, partial [bacterium]|nr:hypothetical protein [bacterium]